MASVSAGMLNEFVGRDLHLDDPGMRAVLRAAAPRIGARLEAVMGPADVAAAFARVAGAAAAKALGEVEARGLHRGR